MDASLLSALGGGLLSLAFAYIPGLSDWFDKLTTVSKRLVMAVALLLVSIGAVALACGQIAIPGVAIVCDQAGVTGVAWNFVFALVANQSAYTLAVRQGGSSPAQ